MARYLCAAAAAFLILSLGVWGFDRAGGRRAFAVQRAGLWGFGVYLAVLFFSQIRLASVWALQAPSVHLLFLSAKGGEMAENLGKTSTFLAISAVWFLPMGLFAGLLFREGRRLGRMICLGAGAAFLVELLNLFSYAGAVPAKILAETAGVLVGSFLARGLLRFLPFLRTRMGVYKKSGRGRYVPQEHDLPRSLPWLLFALVFSLFFGTLSNGLFLLSAQPEGEMLSLDLGARNVCVLQVENGKLYDAKGIFQKISPASTTKLLTALTVLAHADPEEAVTVGEEIQLIASDSSKANLEVGDVLNIHQLLIAMLLPSGNDAAYASAVYVGRKLCGEEASVETALRAFLLEMNRQARECGAYSSNFLSPDGYDREGQYTTAKDLAMIMEACLSNQEIAGIMGSFSLTETWLNGKTVTYYNSNALLNSASGYYVPEVIGGKTGTSSGAGNCLVSAARIGENTYIAVVMGTEGEGRWADSLAIYQALRGA